MTQPDLRTAGAVLTSHVLDTTAGCPGDGVLIRLWRLDDERTIDIAEARTNAAGRCDAPLLREGAIPGIYRLDFHMGDYFGAGSNGFLDIVPVEFHISDAGRHYHVPLVASRWGYSTYRGVPPSRAPTERPPNFRSPARPGARDAEAMAARPPAVGGHGLTTHAIDLARGVGAGGLVVEVGRCAGPGGTAEEIGRHETTVEGRTRDWLVAADEFAPGTYELLFRVGDYYRALAEWAPAVFFEVARVRFEVHESRVHHHVPLLLAPWGYSVYRGS